VTADPAPLPIPFEVIPDGIAVRIRLTPNASANRIDGVADGPDGPVLKARVTAVPEKGKANAALIKLLAKSLGIAKGRISLTGGARDRRKKLLIAGGGAAELAALQALVARARAG